MTFRIGIDGGGTKTEGILLDATGAIVARQVVAGCNPNVAGPDAARRIVTDLLAYLRAQAALRDPTAAITHTHVYAAGNRAWWRETADTLHGFGAVFTADDSHPVLELATHGRPGLVLHGGTGSFVAARGTDGAIHYAGGLGWRFGDAGAGYDLGRRAIGRGLLELQGWAPLSPLGVAVRDHTQLGATADAAVVTRFFYQHADPNRQIAGLAPAILRLASEGEPTAREAVEASVREHLGLALRVTGKLFPGVDPSTLPAGLSGPILTHPAVIAILAAESPLQLAPVAGTPIDGVRRLLARAE
jgi:N-acetylglucosamine kinase-like BadF-type ATPase